MSRKDRKKKKRKKKRGHVPTSGGQELISGDPGLSFSFSRLDMEKTMAHITRLIEEQEFDSEEELGDFLDRLVGMPPPALPPLSPMDKAQELAYDAWDMDGPARLALARQALELSQDCADAHIIVAEETAKSLQESKELFQVAVEAGERAVGPELFETGAGHFWGLIHTRPYMRARSRLADTLWSLGERKEAIAHYTDMLRLNPGDNQGLRYILANCYLIEGDDQALGELLASYEDDIAAAWSYSRALSEFRTGGDGEEAKEALRKALETNEFVPDYLLGEKTIPRRLPDYVGFGDEDEAVCYVAETRGIWEATEGALAWVARETGADYRRGGATIN